MTLPARFALFALVITVAGSEVKAGTEQMDAAQVFADPLMTRAAQAIDRDDVASLEGLARSGLDVNKRGKQGTTLLLWAMRGRKKASMRALLRLKANPDLKLDNGDAPVTIAAGAPDSEILKILLEAGADANARNRLGDPAIDEALDRSLWSNFDLLVVHRADPGATDRAGSTPLVRLAQVNQFIDVERLLDRGIDVNKPNHQGHTLLWYVQRSPVDPAHPQGKARDRVLAALRQRGAR